LVFVGPYDHQTTSISLLNRDFSTILLPNALRDINMKGKGKAVPLQAWSGPERSRKLRFPNFMITAQGSDKLPALRTGRLYPQEMLLVLISVRG